MKTLYCTQGTLRVTKTRGFWFSGGGVKGSFGFYPHLKDRDGNPVYADTQIRGDLRAAVSWKERGLPDDDALFPTRGEKGSPLYLTDMELANHKTWNKAWWTRKPRIKVDGVTSTVEQGMLAMKEKAFFNDHELQSRLYISYASSDDAIKALKGRLSNAAPLVGGVGAERSRMLFMGKFTLEWDENISKLEVPDSHSADKFTAVLALNALVHFRNRLLTGEKSSMLQCLPYITVDQLRAWFAQAHKLCFDDWPTPAQMQCLSFSDLYPAFRDGGNVALAYPASVNTSERDGIVADNTGRPQEDEHTEQFLGKPSTLPRGVFVTDEPRPRIVRADIERRMRNAMEGNYRTKEQGLFVQEFVPRGTLFAGRITCSGDREFNGRTKFILENLRPWISRCLFEPQLILTNAEPLHEQPKPPALVITAAPYVDSIATARTANQVTLSTTKGYNATLRRPRRNRITVASGSVINDVNSTQELCTSLLGWQGFGGTFHHEVKVESPRSGETPSPETPPEVKVLSRAQEGNLRRFLHPGTKKEVLKRWLESETEKRKQGKPGIDGDTLKGIGESLEAPGDLKTAQKYIRAYLDRMRQQRWDSQEERLKTKLEAEKLKFLEESDKPDGGAS